MAFINVHEIPASSLFKNAPGYVFIQSNAYCHI